MSVPGIEPRISCARVLKVRAEKAKGGKRKKERCAYEN
ncbi:hypothetical protein SNOG_12401 [Parastagonospora nodorum SN15]|uniref:Uncharacterized protein n=1 Tax=Phaeosphaeria nodorum (strain SN15 / ATCC MYA-4574 / FGSC 10173) TaxID=321614 RepID=Q0U763_PHANO|nr:hypothetical protein SNOG_12401 [Parastagonospora nodorum SN15]EAT80214.1 hypothetical protein SNOG_12401 [Parastagonospora nodorum SN15]